MLTERASRKGGNLLLQETQGIATCALEGAVGAHVEGVVSEVPARAPCDSERQRTGPDAGRGAEGAVGAWGSFLLIASVFPVKQEAASPIRGRWIVQGLSPVLLQIAVASVDQMIRLVCI